MLPLLCWLSPSFPIGAYAYSHGLEWAADAGDVTDEASLESWLGGLLEHGFIRNDAILVAAAFRCAPDPEALREVNEVALAFAGSAEFRLETAQQGRSFLDAVASAWATPDLVRLAAAFDEVALPVAFAAASRAYGIELAVALPAYATAACGNLVSAALRLLPVGQTAGQRILARIVPRVAELAREWQDGDLDDLGSATVRADLGSLRHETQYTRLFRS